MFAFLRALLVVSPPMEVEEFRFVADPGPDVDDDDDLLLDPLAVAEVLLVTDERLMERAGGIPSPGTTIPKFFARTICKSRTSRVLDPRC